MKFKSKPQIIVGGAVLIGFVILGRLVFFPTKAVPEEFNDARLKGAAIAQNIVAFSNSAISGLEEISQYDKNGDVSEALILISNKLIENRENQEEAVRLASQLEKMARNLTDIKPSSARQVAAEAVSAEVALVSRLVSYNDYLKQLFEVLRTKFETRNSYTNGRVDALIKNINDEAAAINDLDRRFNEALAKFDELIK